MGSRREIVIILVTVVTLGTTLTMEMPTTLPQNARWQLALPRQRHLELSDRPKVMGIVNITPDSFSDGGRWLDSNRAIDHAHELLAAGADILDLGAESTRPGGGVYGEGAHPVSAEEEIDRLLPALVKLRGQTQAPISVDTRKAAVARAALEAGADLINDVGGFADPDLVEVLASRPDVPAVMMHSRGDLRTMQRRPMLGNAVVDVQRQLAETLERVAGQGIAAQRVIVDPGLGFGKTAAQNLDLLRRLDALMALGRPVLVGASRKSFVGAITGEPAADRLPGSLASAAWAARHGAAILRVHDVDETVRFLKVWHAIEDARAES